MMANEKNTATPKTDKENKDELVKPDPETTHTTDPQDHMKGPISSVVQGIKDEAEKDDTKTQAPSE